jgi:hypothetical protein
MRLPLSANDPCAWRISEVVPDFTLEDLWALPVHGDAGEFAQLVGMLPKPADLGGDSAAARSLFAIRLRLGQWLGWDEGEPRPIPGCTECSLLDRLPPDLRTGPPEPRMGPVGFQPLFRTATEWAGELSNSTMHGVLHLGWIEDGDGGWSGQMRIYVKPRGRFGAAYMDFIRPLRYGIVYPAMLRQIGRAWAARPSRTDPAPEPAAAPGRST